MKCLIQPAAARSWANSSPERAGQHPKRVRELQYAESVRPHFYDREMRTQRFGLSTFGTRLPDSMRRIRSADIFGALFPRGKTAHSSAGSVLNIQQFTE